MKQIIIMAIGCISGNVAMAYPVIVKITNDRDYKIDVISPSKNDPVLIIPSKESSDFIVRTDDSLDLQVAYSSGAIPDINTGEQNYYLTAPLKNAIGDCLKEAPTRDSNVQLCEFKIEKKRDWLVTRTYELKSMKALDTGVPKGDFVQVLDVYAPNQERLFPKPKAQENKVLLKKFIGLYDRVYQQLQKATQGQSNVVKQLGQALVSYHAYVDQDRGLGNQHILFLGDQGTGKDGAKQVARDMYATCLLKSCDFAISAGDNIYDKGPKISDKGWETKFEKQFVDIYRPMWDDFHLPFYMTLGNHDIGVDSFLDTDWVYLQSKREALGKAHYKAKRIDRMDAQVAFESSNTNPKSGHAKMWNMPGATYSEFLDHNRLRTFIVSLNTNYFPANIRLEDSKPLANQEQSAWLQKEFARDEQNIEEKAENKELTKQLSDWRIAFGHHAMYSIGRHGVNTDFLGFKTNDKVEMNNLRATLKPVLCDNKVDLYLVGHDHHLQIDQIKCPNGHIITQILSGAAAKEEAESSAFEKVFGHNAFSASALYDEFVWGNGLDAAEIKAGEKARRLLGFSFITLAKDKAEIEMIESTIHGPNTLACFTFDKKTLSRVQCRPDQDMTPLFSHFAIFP